MTQIGFTDDPALISTAKTQNTLEYIANKAIGKVVTWMETTKMELAVEKTKALILYDPRKRDSVSFKIRDTEIRPSKKLKYLGVILDDKGTFGTHIRYATRRRRSLLPPWANECQMLEGQWGELERSC